MIRKSLAFFLLAACVGGEAFASDPRPSRRFVVEPNPALAKPRLLGEVEMEALLRSAQGKSREAVLRLLGHPHRVLPLRDGREIWVYQWNEQCTLTFRGGICDSWSRSE
jgi:hypothetical protein